MHDKLRNSSLFREVNNRIRDVHTELWGDAFEPVGFLCECGGSECTDVLDLTIADYEAIRSVPDRFLLLRGHESSEVEDVIARNNGYLIVEKRTPERVAP